MVVVPLAAVGRPDRVEPAVASHLGLRLAGEAGADDVAAALADRELLLVLDNCEHLVEACRRLVVAIRRAAAGVRVLATSRVTLQVPGEYVVRLQPLPVPRDAADLDALRRQPGVRAFVEHARRRAAGFEIGPDDAADLVEVLRRLDGLPLGIELAARQVAVMPLRAVRERLDRALDLATGRRGPEDARQRTLRASIASSYELLDEDEQRLLRALASFPGGVDLATVEAVADGDGDPLDLLHDLVDSSLLVADAASGRYRVLFIVRAFLSDLVVTLGETEAARERFVSRCVVVAEEICEGMLRRPTNRSSTDGCAPSSTTCGRLATSRANTETWTTLVAITLAAILVGTWRDLREIWAWVIELADDPDLAGRPDRVLMLSLAAEAARLSGDFAAVARLLRRGVRSGRRGDRPSSPRASVECPGLRGPLPWRLRGGGVGSGCGAPPPGQPERRARDQLGRTRVDVRRSLERGPRAARPGREAVGADRVGVAACLALVRRGRVARADQPPRRRCPTTARPSCWPRGRAPASSRASRGCRS